MLEGPAYQKLENTFRDICKGQSAYTISIYTQSKSRLN